jgi:hypothetical protein
MNKLFEPRDITELFIAGARDESLSEPVDFFVIFAGSAAEPIFCRSLVYNTFSRRSWTSNLRKAARFNDKEKLLTAFHNRFNGSIELTIL